MASKLNTKDKKKELGKKTFPQWLLQTVVSLYVFIMLAIYPLATHNKYYDIGNFKYSFFKNVTMVAMICLIVLSPIYLICERNSIT